MHAIARSERFDSMKERRFYSALQPQRAFHPSFPHNNVGESPAGLKSYAALLRVYRNWTASFDELDVSVEQLAKRRIFAGEVIIERIVAARMPHIAGHELMTAFRASPERRLLLAHFRFLRQCS
jgi:hypothetical protein